METEIFTYVRIPRQDYKTLCWRKAICTKLITVDKISSYGLSGFIIVKILTDQECLLHISS